MIIYVSMILWIPFIYFFYSLNHKEEIKHADYNLSQGKIEKVPIGYCILVFGFFVFWIGLRSGIADTSGDIRYFQIISSDFSTAWNTINWVGKSPGYDVIYLFSSIPALDKTTAGAAQIAAMNFPSFAFSLNSFNVSIKNSVSAKLLDPT